MNEANMWLFCVVWHFAFGFAFYAVFRFVLMVRRHGIPRLQWGADRTEKIGYGASKPK
jgi:hypothetical protein